MHLVLWDLLDLGFDIAVGILGWYMAHAPQKVARLTSEKSRKLDSMRALCNSLDGFALQVPASAQRSTLSSSSSI
jgi:hypothetical protein